ncbi:MAG: PH domain-containing protein [Candidatus Thorarchaeota archaeon]|nr:PH domain-containing protein [Candidatus Thorarchaeota archaeon]
MSGTRAPEKPQQEHLIAKFTQKRDSALVFYLFGILLFFLGWLFMILSSIGYVTATFEAWYIGLWSMTLGSLAILWAEIRRRYTLYAITSWTVRARKGYLNHVTTRVFLDEITEVNILVDAEERIVDQGDVEIFVAGETTPAVVLMSVDNPRGIKEIIISLTKTIPEPLPWAHIERSRIVTY